VEACAFEKCNAMNLKGRLMQWSDETPTERGVYWVKVDWGNPYLVLFEPSQRPYALCVHYFGSKDSGQIEGYVGAKWYGPLMAPPDDVG